MPPRTHLLGALAAQVSPARRQKKDMDEGVGLHRLQGLLEQLPDSVLVVIRPSLGLYLYADFAVIGPGKVLIVTGVHWKGRIGTGESFEWLGAGSIDLGRPDRRASRFAEKLAFSRNAPGFAVEAAVIFTDCPVDFHGPEPEAPLVQWTEAERFLRETFAAGLGSDGDIEGLAALLKGK